METVTYRPWGNGNSIEQFDTMPITGKRYSPDLVTMIVDMQSICMGTQILHLGQDIMYARRTLVNALISTPDKMTTGQ